MKNRSAQPLVLLAATLFLPALGACEASRAERTSAVGALRDCIASTPFPALLKEAAPQTFAGRNSTFATTLTQTLFDGRQRWSQEFSSHQEILPPDASNFASLCGALEESLRSSCGTVSTATVGAATPPEQLAVSASCTLFLTHQDQSAVVSALVLPQSTGNSRVLVLAHGW